jgi:hypothetical protein
MDSKRARREDDEGEAQVAEPPVRAPYGPRKGGWVFEIRNTVEEIRARATLKLEGVKMVASKAEAWRHISERLGHPFPEKSSQFTNASTKYNKRTQLIIPDPFEHSFNIFSPQALFASCSSSMCVIPPTPLLPPPLPPYCAFFTPTPPLLTRLHTHSLQGDYQDIFKAHPFEITNLDEVNLDEVRSGGGGGGDSPHYTMEADGVEVVNSQEVGGGGGSSSSSRGAPVQSEATLELGGGGGIDERGAEHVSSAAAAEGMGGGGSSSSAAGGGGGGETLGGGGEEHDLDGRLDAPGYVYVVTGELSQYVKIGFTKFFLVRMRAGK